MHTSMLDTLKESLKKITDLFSFFSKKPLESLDTLTQKQEIATPGTGDYADVKAVHITMPTELASRCLTVNEAVSEARALHKEKFPENFETPASFLCDREGRPAIDFLRVEKEKANGELETLQNSSVGFNLTGSKGIQVKVEHVDEQGQKNGSTLDIPVDLSAANHLSMRELNKEELFKQRYDELLENKRKYGTWIPPSETGVSSENNPVRLLEKEIESRLANVVLSDKDHDVMTTQGTSSAQNEEKRWKSKSIVLNLHYLLLKELSEAEKMFNAIKEDRTFKDETMTIDFKNVMNLARQNPEGLAFKTLSVDYLDEDNKDVLKNGKPTQLLYDMKMEFKECPTYGYEEGKGKVGGYITRSTVFFDTPLFKDELEFVKQKYPYKDEYSSPNFDFREGNMKDRVERIENRINDKIERRMERAREEAENKRHEAEETRKQQQILEYNIKQYERRMAMR